MHIAAESPGRRNVPRPKRQARTGFPAISLQQPYADLVVAGKKDIENRNWPTRFRGRILIHASRTVDRDAVRRHRALLGARTESDYRPVTGAIIGMVRITDCVRSHRSRWFWGRFGFVLEGAIRFRAAVPYRGWLGIFDVPWAVLKATSAYRAKPGSFAHTARRTTNENRRALRGARRSRASDARR